MLAQILRRFLADQDGATAIEYALLGTLVAVALVATFYAMGDSLTALFDVGPGGAGDVIQAQAQKL